MPLILSYLPSFERSLKTLDSRQKETVRLLLEVLIAYYASNCDLSEAQKIAPRFFYKQLRKPFYEAGVEGKIRLIIRRDKSDCFAVLIGNHEQVQRFLANH